MFRVRTVIHHVIRKERHNQKDQGSGQYRPQNEPRTDIRRPTGRLLLIFVVDLLLFAPYVTALNDVGNFSTAKKRHLDVNTLFRELIEP